MRTIFLVRSNFIFVSPLPKIDAAGSFRLADQMQSIKQHILFISYSGLQSAILLICLSFGISLVGIQHNTFVKRSGFPGGFLPCETVYPFQALLDALLPQYKFEFVPSKGGDDLLLSVQTGKSQGAVRNWFQTEERKQIFTFPKKNLGLSVTGLTVRTEDLDKIYDFATVSAAGGHLAPVDPGDGHYTVLKNWNDANPDKAWDFETGSIASSTDAYVWVAEGRYDAYFGLEVIFNYNVLAEDGPAHAYADKLSWTPCAAIPTYVIFGKEYQGLADDFDSVIDGIWESGYPGYLQESLYGTDYISIYGRDGLGFQK